MLRVVVQMSKLIAYLFIVLFLFSNFIFSNEQFKANPNKTRSYETETYSLIDDLAHKIRTLEREDKELFNSFLKRINQNETISESQKESLITNISNETVKELLIQLISLINKICELKNNFQSSEHDKIEAIPDNERELKAIMQNLDEMISLMIKDKVSKKAIDVLIDSLDEYGFSHAAQFAKIKSYYLQKISIHRNGKSTVTEIKQPAKTRSTETEILSAIDKLFVKMESLNDYFKRRVMLKLNLLNAFPADYNSDDKMKNLLFDLSEDAQEVFNLYLIVPKKIDELESEFEKEKKEKIEKLSQDDAILREILQNPDDFIINVNKGEITETEFNTTMDLLEKNGFSKTVKYLRIKKHYFELENKIVKLRTKLVRN